MQTLAEIGSDITIDFDTRSAEDSIAIIAQLIHRMIMECAFGAHVPGQSGFEIMTYIMKDTQRSLEELAVGKKLIGPIKHTQI